MKNFIFSFIVLLFGPVVNLFAQCAGCNQTITLSATSQTLNYSAPGNNQTICVVKNPALVGNATITSGTIDINNRPNTSLCFGPGVVVGSNVNINNNNNQFTITNYGTFAATLNLTTGQTTVNNHGSVTGNINLNSGTFNNLSGGSVNTSTFNMNGGSFNNNAGSSFTLSNNFTPGGGSFTGTGTVAVSGNVQINNGVTVQMNGNTTITGNLVNSSSSTQFTGGLQVNGSLENQNGNSMTVGGGVQINGNLDNNGTFRFSGNVNVTGNIINRNGRTITSNSASCKSLCGASISNSGTISSTAGPNMGVCQTINGGTQTNIILNVPPTASASALNLSSTNLTVNGSFSAANPVGGGYMVLRKPNAAFTNADLPQPNSIYSVGSTIGSATVVALLNSATTNFSNNPSCGTFYYAVVTSSNASGSCGSYFTSSYTTQGPVVIQRSASIAYPKTNFCRASDGLTAVTLTGNTGGTYTRSPVGLSINATTGNINPSGSSVGNYVVTYTLAATGNCPIIQSQATVNVLNNVSNPTALTGGGPICQSTASTAHTTTVSNQTALNWSVTGAGNSVSGSGTNVSVNWNPAFTGQATISVFAEGCGGPTNPVSTVVTVRPTGQWIGANNNWNTANNWCGGVPTITSDVIIPTGATFMPQITANSFARTINIQPNTSLTITGNNQLDIAEEITNNGTFSPSANSTVRYISNNPATILAANYGNLSTSGTGTKTFASGSTTRIAGTFSPGADAHQTSGSTIEFNGGSAQNIPGFTFYNLSTSGNNQKSLSGDVLVSNSLNLQNGTLDLGSNTLNLGGTIAGAGTLSGSCSSTLTISGAGNTGNLNFTAGARQLGTLNLTKFSPGNVTLGSNLDICTQLQLTQGKLILNSNQLTLVSGANSSNGNANAYVQTLDQPEQTGAGFFIQEVVPNAPEVVFPVGTSQSYSPAFLRNFGALRNFRVRVFNDVFEHGTSGSPITNLDFSVRKTWDIEPVGTGGSPNVSLKLQWNVTDEGNNFAYHRLNEQIYIGKNENTNFSLWVRQPVTTFNYDDTPYSISTSDITSFSTFSIGSDLAPLPISLGNVQLIARNNTAVLKWATYSEKDSRGFLILKSRDGTNFHEAGYVEAAGNSLKIKNYTFEDHGLSGKWYFRLKFIGLDESDVEFSQIVSANFDQSVDVELFPNPVSDILNIRTNGSLFDNISIDILNLRGQLVQKHNMRVEQTSINISDLPSGLYLVKIEITGSEKRHIRIAKK